jgi:hypothetical protein
VIGYVLKYASKVYNDFETVRESQAYLYWVTGAKLEGEAYKGYEFVGIFDYFSLDPPPPVVTDEWVDLHRY